MRNYKRLAAMAMVATMVVGNAIPVFADGTTTTPGAGGASGTGGYEGYLEETSAFSVSVPTDASSTKGFNFFVDPNGLLAATNYARISGATAADFETGSSLFFERTPDSTASPAVVKYGKDSEKIELTNMSSYAVDVEVAATVTGADDIKLAATAPASGVTDPTLYLAIVSGSDTAAIVAEGGKLTSTIAGEPNNFEPKYDAANSKYIYGLKGSTTEASPTSPWKKLSFNLTGACAGTWTDAQADVTPTVNLTWKVTDPNAAPTDVAPSITDDSTTYQATADTAIFISIDLGTGALAADADNAISSIKFTAPSGAERTLADTEYNVTAEGKLRLKPTTVNGFIGSGATSREYTITFNNSANTEVTFTLSQ